MRHAGDGAARGGIAPDQPAEERRRELRDGGEGQNADGGELGVAGRAVIHVGEQQDGEDRQPPHGEQQRADVLAATISSASRRCSTQGTTMSLEIMMASATVSTITMAVAADRPPTKASDGEHVRSGVQRQRQHEHVAVDLAGREGEQAGDGDRHHEQVDQHQIDREHPARALDLALVVVLHDGDVELPRQQQDRDERQERHRDQRVGGGLAGQHRGGRQRLSSRG